MNVGCDFTQPIYKDIIEAQEYIKVGRYDKAIMVYEKIVKRNPGKEIKTKMFYQLGELYSKNLINNTKALQYYELVTENSDDPLWLVKAVERISDINFNYKKNYEKSITTYKKLKNFHPKLNNFDYYQYRLAKSYYLNNQTKEALHEYKQIQRDKNHKFYSLSYYEEALIYFHLKKWQKTISFLKNYINIEDKKEKIIEAKYILANCYEMTEELKKAYNVYYSILGKYPNTKIINNRLNSIYERRVARKR